MNRPEGGTSVDAGEAIYLPADMEKPHEDFAEASFTKKDGDSWDPDYPPREDRTDVINKRAVI